jgi:hypothetical protein
MINLVLLVFVILISTNEIGFFNSMYGQQLGFIGIYIELGIDLSLKNFNIITFGYIKPRN